jgi:hypothetical protein
MLCKNLRLVRFFFDKINLLSLLIIYTGYSDSESHDGEDDKSDDDQALPPRYLRINEPQSQSIEGETVEVIDGPTVQAHVDLATTASRSCLFSSKLQPFNSFTSIGRCT